MHACTYMYHLRLEVSLEYRGKGEEGGGERELMRIASWVFENISFLRSLPVTIDTVSSVLISLSFIKKFNSLLCANA